MQSLQLGHTRKIKSNHKLHVSPCLISFPFPVIVNKVVLTLELQLAINEYLLLEHSHSLHKGISCFVERRRNDPPTEI